MSSKAALGQSIVSGALAITAATQVLGLIAALHAGHRSLATFLVASGLVYLALYFLRHRVLRVRGKHLVIALGYAQGMVIALGFDISPVPFYVLLPSFIAFITMYHDPMRIRLLAAVSLGSMAALYYFGPAGSIPVPGFPFAIASAVIVTVGFVSVYDYRSNAAHWLEMQHMGDILRQRERSIVAETKQAQAQSEQLAFAKTKLEEAVARDAELHRQLRLVNEERAQLARAASNDLKQPLRNIGSFIQLSGRRLEKLGLADDVRDYLAFVTDGATRMDAMVDDLLRYCDYQSCPQLEEVDTEEVLLTIQRNLTDLLTREGASLVFDPGLPVIMGQRTQVLQLFQNLISNGIKFKREGVPPQCTIGCLVGNDAIEFYIRDNGIGMPANRLKDVFGLFTRLHERGSYEGTGIGLALCRRIVLGAGGEIWCESVEGEGTTFRFTWPLAQGSDSNTHASEDEHQLSGRTFSQTTG